jgi:hypothetical protein
MRSLLVVACVFSLVGVASAQQGLPVDENTADLCSDGADNDHNGLVDCQDPRCFGMPNCPVPGQKPLMLARPRPAQELVAGALLIVSGLALGGISGSVIYYTERQTVFAQSPAYIFGASLTASSVAMVILGAYYIRSGTHRRQNERRLGLDLTSIEPSVSVDSHGGTAGVSLHF